MLVNDTAAIADATDATDELCWGSRRASSCVRQSCRRRRCC